jgi:hypothetical protein
MRDNHKQIIFELLSDYRSSLQNGALMEVPINTKCNILYTINWTDYPIDVYVTNVTKVEPTEHSVEYGYDINYSFWKHGHNSKVYIDRDLSAMPFPRFPMNEFHEVHQYWPQQMNPEVDISNFFEQNARPSAPKRLYMRGSADAVIAQHLANAGTTPVRSIGIEPRLIVGHQYVATRKSWKNENIEVVFTCAEEFNEDFGHIVNIESVEPQDSIYEETLITDVEETDKISWFLNRFFINGDMSFNSGTTFVLRELE